MEFLSLKIFSVTATRSFFSWSILPVPVSSTSTLGNLCRLFDFPPGRIECIHTPVLAAWCAVTSTWFLQRGCSSVVARMLRSWDQSLASPIFSKIDQFGINKVHLSIYQDVNYNFFKTPYTNLQEVHVLNTLLCNLHKINQVTCLFLY